MPLVDLDKTSYKFRDVLWFLSGALIVVGGMWRFELNSTRTNDKIDALESKIMYRYELEILKINNRIDLLEAKKFALRKKFKTTNFAKNNISIANFKVKANNNKRSDKKYPQLCIGFPPRQPEFQKKKLVDLKILI
jgi:hypothetical protein